jgi:hypothetical protein
MSQATPHDDFAFEPIRGLPEVPPEGERILWQGAPEWRGLAWRAFHIREVAFYFALLIALQPALALLRGTSLAATVPAMLWTGLAAAAALGILAVLAYASARSTVYTITSRRVVMRIGVALPVTINLPFAVIADAGLKPHRDGGGDLALGIMPGERVSWAVLWPHVRPWRLARPQPMLRAIPDAAAVAEILGRALAAHAGMSAPARSVAPAAANDARLPQGVAAAG